MPNPSTERASLDNLFAQVHQLTFAPLASSHREQLGKLLDAIHAAPVDEKKKLREKDQALVNGIDAYRQFVLERDWMPAGILAAFVILADLLDQIEAILWELKKEPGPVPKPQGQKPPSPRQA